MAIHIICGKPGGGKSLFGMHLLVKELVETNRNIVTNLAVKLPELNEYVQKQHPQEDYKIPQRLRILTDDETKKFWNHRSAEANDGSNGVAYFLDEAHEHFNAREWASLHRDALHYLSQHRKLGDVVFPITQAPGNLDKQFRSVAQDYIHVRNEYTAKYLIFRGMGRFVVKMFYGDPTMGSRLDYFDRSVFKLDAKGLANCYDTAKGVGVLGSKADKGARAKGLPIWTVFPMAAAAGLLCLLIPWFFAKGVTRFMGGAVKQKIAAINPANTLGPALPAHFTFGQGGPPPSSTSAPSAPGSPAAAASDTPPPVVVTGLLIGGNQVLAMLSDGRYLHEDQIGKITKWDVFTLDGHRYEISHDVGKGTPPPPKPPEPPPPAPVNTTAVSNDPVVSTLGNLAPPENSPPKLGLQPKRTQPTKTPP